MGQREILNKCEKLAKNYNCFLHEPVERGESLHFEAACEGVVLRGVDLRDRDGWVLAGKLGRSESIFRGKLLAVATTQKTQKESANVSKGQRGKSIEHARNTRFSQGYVKVQGELASS